MSHLKDIRNSRASISDYIEYRMNRAKQAVDLISSNIDIKNKRILDIGCGYGNLSYCMASHGGNITAIDLDKERLKLAKKYNSHEKITYDSNDLSELPEHDFDMVSLFDVLEHVSSYDSMLENLSELIKPEGYIFIEYNPYYSFIGHHLYDYTFLPVQYFPYTVVEKLVRSRADKGGIFSSEQSLQQFRELNGITARKLRKIIRRLGFRVLYERNEINHPIFGSINTGIFRHIPFIEDFFSFAHILILQKTVAK